MTPERMEAAVVDASVGIKLFIQEDGSAQADRLFNQLAGDPPARYYVPDLFYIECANILWKYVRRFGYPPENARQDVADLKALVLYSIPTADLLPEALEIALAFDVTAYDACYVALARQLELPLVTADVALAEHLVESGVLIRLLSAI